MERSAADEMLLNSGSIIGVPQFAAGEVGEAMYCAGRQGLSVASNPSLSFGPGGEFSIEAWIRPIEASTSYGVMDIVDKRVTPAGDITDAQGFSLALSYGKLSFQMCDVLGKAVLQVGTTAPDLRDLAWHHVAVTVKPSSAAGCWLYIDGLPAVNFDPTGYEGSLSNSAPLLIGLHPSYPLINGDFHGAIDEVSVYKRALSAAEIQAIFIAGAAGKCVPQPVLTSALYMGLTIEGLLGQNYAIQYRTNNNTGDWIPLTTITVTQRPMLWFDPSPANQSARFYRAFRLP